MTQSGIYIIKNLVNNKVYVGSAFNLSNRFSTHKYRLRRNKHRNKHLQSAYNLYGERNFLFEVLEFVENKEDILEREQYYLDLFSCYDRNKGYNICKTAGNTAGVLPSKETRKKMSEAALRRPKRTMPEHQRELLSEMFSGVGKKINWEIVREIRKLYSNGGISQREIAERYGIFQTTVSEIIRNKIWKDENYKYVRKRNKRRQND